jgi:excisionase family DNA binding protein
MRNYPIAEKKMTDEREYDYPELSVRDIGTSGIDVQNGYVNEEPLRVLQGRDGVLMFREMVDNDPICGGAAQLMKSLVRQSPLAFEPADGSNMAAMIAEHVSTCWDDMTSSADETLGDMLTFFEQGHSLHEIVYKVRRGEDREEPFLRSKYNDGRIGWLRLPIRKQETLERWDIGHGGIINGVWQVAMPDYEEKYIPMRNSVLFRTSNNAGNPLGRSMLRSAFTSYYRVKRYRDFEAIGVERDLVGMLVLELPPSMFKNKADQTTIENYVKAGMKARKGEYAVFPFPAEKHNGQETGFKARLMQSGGRNPIDINAIIVRIEGRMAIAFLGDVILAGMQGTGTYNLTEIKKNITTLAVNAIQRTAENQLNRVVIPRLVKLNQWPTELSPQAVFGDVDTGGIAELMPALAAAVQSAVVTPGSNLESYVRTKLGVPLEEELSTGQMQDAMGELDELDPNTEAIKSEEAVAATVPIEGEPSVSMTPEEASDMTGLSAKRIIAAIRRGQIPGAKIGNTYRMLRQHFLDYMAGVDNRA